MSTKSPPVEPRPLGILTPETHISALRYSPCGSVLAGASFDQRIRRWDLRNVPAPDPEEKKQKVTEYPAARLPDVVTGHNGFVSTVEFHPSRILAISADTWGAIHAWPYLAENPKVIWSSPEAHDGWVRDLAMGPDGDWFASCGRDNMVRVFSTIDGQLLREFSDHVHDVFAVAAHPDGKHIVSGDLSGRVLVLSLDSGTVERELPFDDLYLLHRLQDLAGIRRLKISSDGKTLAVIGCIPSGGANFRGQALVRLIDLETGNIRHDMLMGDAAKNAIAHDGELLPNDVVMAVTTGQSGSGTLFLHKAGDEKPLYELSRGTVNNHAVARSPDGNQFAVAATSGRSSGNGKPLDKDGNYLGSHSPIHVFAWKG